MILSRLQSLVPRWMLDTPRVAFSQLMATFASLGDGMVEGVLDARFAWLPGQLDVPGGNGFDNFDALSRIGRDRAIRQGYFESPFEYAARLRVWLSEWARSATPFELLNQLAAILSPNPPRLVIITSGSSWYVRHPDGTFQTYVQTVNGVTAGFTYDPATGDLGGSFSPPHVWVWDASSLPPPLDQNDSSRWWLVIDCPCNLPFLASDDHTFDDPGVVSDGWNDLTHGGYELSPDAGTVGLSAPWKLIELARVTVYEWRAAGLKCAYLIANFDPTAFQPLADSSPSSVPDGTWGWHTRYDVGSNTQVVARFQGAEYIPGTPGGGALQ